ncbi:MAG: hypothetical protein RMK50_01240 [Nitrososphaerota archaeon]|nr:hypothetical protein [Candidatus Bathyarchaeota archaeon]MDW8193440.1 hypothetical protein [Nitrososphaerota archaeon]
MARSEKFEEDLKTLISILRQGMAPDHVVTLCNLMNQLVELHRHNIVKINHSVMELICAKYLIERGYQVEIEKPLAPSLTCDLFGVKGYGSLIVEIETGFVPPEHALDPQTYLAARIASKIVRYSSFADKFALGFPPYYFVQFPEFFAQPTKARKKEDLINIKKLCDRYYRNPPVSLKEIETARVHAVYVIDVDSASVREVDPEDYIKKAS